MGSNHAFRICRTTVVSCRTFRFRTMSSLTTSSLSDRRRRVGYVRVTGHCLSIVQLKNKFQNINISNIFNMLNK